MSDSSMALFVSILHAVMDDSLSDSEGSSSDADDRDLSRYDINRGNLRRRALRDDMDSESDDSENQPPLSPRAAVRSIMSLEGEECKISVDKNPHHEANIDDVDMDQSLPIPSLLDLAAQCVAKTCTCERLEFTDPPLDEALLRKIAFWAFPVDEAKVKAFANMTDHVRAWVRGQTLVKEGRVKEMWQVGFMATAYLAKFSKEESSSSSDIRVSLTFERQRILSSTCSECKNDIWCTHVVAAVIFRMQNPDKVIVHAPMTETLSTLDRHQLQKLVQYAVQEDPAGILGKVFKHIDSVRDTMSDMNKLEGAPDPTFGTLKLEKSHWDLSVEVMEKTLAKSLSNLTAGPTFTWIESSSSRNKYYPDCFDQTKKQHAHMNWFNSRVVELMRNGEFTHAAEVLIVLMKNVIAKLKEVSDMSSRNLKRFFHDLSRFYALTMMYVQEKDPSAWRLLDSAAKEMNSSPGLLLHSLETSVWAELPSLASCIRDVNLEQTEALYEPIAAGRLSAPPPNFYEFLDDTSPVEMHPYSEPIPVMFARLQAINLFGKMHKNYTNRMTRLGLKLLDQLSKIASQYSIIGEYLARTTCGSTEGADQKTVGFLIDRTSTKDCDVLDTSLSGTNSSAGLTTQTALSMPGISELSGVTSGESDKVSEVSSPNSPQPGPSTAPSGRHSSKTSSLAGSRSNSPVFGKECSVLLEPCLPGPSGLQSFTQHTSSHSKSSTSSGSSPASEILPLQMSSSVSCHQAGDSVGEPYDLRGSLLPDEPVVSTLNRRKSPRADATVSRSAKRARGATKTTRRTRQTRSMGNLQMRTDIQNDDQNLNVSSSNGANSQLERTESHMENNQMVIDPPVESSTIPGDQQLSGATNDQNCQCANSSEAVVSSTKNGEDTGPSTSGLQSRSGSPRKDIKPKGKKKMSVGTLLRSPIRTRAKKRAATSGPSDVPEIKRQRHISAPATSSKGKSTPGSVGKGQKGKGPSKGKLPVKRKRLLPEDDTFPPMTGGQLAYSLMYSVHVVMKYEKKTGHKVCPEQLLLGYVLLALEMGYFRTVAPKDTTQLTEHDWLWRLEQSMSEYMQRKFTAKSKAVHGYLQAFKKVGLDFYESCYPLVLIDNLSSMIALNGEQRQSWGKHLVVILADLLIAIPQSLNKFTLPITSKYAYFIDNTSYKKNVHKDFVMYRIHNITSTLLSMMHVENKQHEELLVKILLNFQEVDMVVLLNLLIKDFKLQLYKLKNNRNIMEALLQFAIKAYRHTRCVQLPNDSVLKDQTFLFSLADNLGLSGIKFFLKDWKSLFSVKDVKGLIYLFESQIREMDSPPEDVVELILQVLKDSYSCGMEACDLLTLFPVGDNNYKLALSKIQENKGSYETSTLFAIAQQHWERKKGRNARNLDTETMRILEAAMEQIQYRGSPLYEQLDWLFKVCTTGPVKDVYKSPHFQKMISMITKHAASAPDVLLRILQNVEKTPSLLKHVESISQALVGSYLEYFSNKLFSCSHSAYNNVINEMLRAKLDCKHFLKDGEAQFDERVVSSIRSLHRNRKKFIRMLDAEFPTVSQRSQT